MYDLGKAAHYQLHTLSPREQQTGLLRAAGNGRSQRGTGKIITRKGVRMKIASRFPQVGIGQLWKSKTSTHGGWIVVVTKVSVNTVHFNVKKGPAKACKSPDQLSLPSFLVTYELLFN